MHFSALVFQRFAHLAQSGGFQLTDPVVHYVSAANPERRHQNGATDKGRNGVCKFFATHKCNRICRRMNLRNFRTNEESLMSGSGGSISHLVLSPCHPG